VAILHGLFGSADNLAQIARELAVDHQVVSIDLPGHGGSAHPEDYAHETMAAVIRAHLAELGITQCSLLGHSLGGKISMQLASDAETDPSLTIEKLMIVDIAPRHYPPHHNEIFQALRSIPLHENMDRSQADDLLTDGIPDAGIRAFLLKSFRRSDDQRWFWRFDLAGLEAQYEKLAVSPTLLNPVQCPTLFIKGADSDYILPIDEAPIRAHFALPEFKIISGAGHWPHAEKPSAFNAIVRRFITSDT